MMLRRLANDGVGLAVAALAAAGVELAFSSLAQGAVSPAFGLTELLLLVATQTFVFALPLALPLILIGEINGVRSWRYYAWAGLLVGAAGWLVLLTSAPGELRGLFNALAISAFAASGLTGGTAYWLAAGRRAGRATPASEAQSSRPEENFAATRL